MSPRRHRQLLAGVLAGAVLGLIGCLEPRGSEVPGYSARLLEAGTPVPHIDADAQLAAQVQGNDGLVSDTIALHQAHVADRTVLYWNFGATSGTVQPVWLFRRRDEDGKTQAFGHPNLIDSIPGDNNYSPLRKAYVVYVTGRYNGELITSFEALEDAMELGLVREPQPLPDVYPWPVTRASATLSMPDGRMLAPTEAFYRGHRVPYIGLDAATTTPGELMLVRDSVRPGQAYRLSRERESYALDEEATGADLNADGDTVDSNLIFDLGENDPGYSGVVSLVDVTVSEDYEFGAITAADELFTEDDLGTKAREAVLDYEDTGIAWFLPIAGDTRDETLR